MTYLWHATYIIVCINSIIIRRTGFSGHHHLPKLKYILQDCGRLDDYRTASVMMIGTTCATIVVLILVTGTLIYQRYKKCRRAREIAKPCCSMETETMSIIELDILNTNSLDTIIVVGADDPNTAVQRLPQDSFRCNPGSGPDQGNNEKEEEVRDIL